MEIVTQNATSLAWVGDAIMSLRVREHLLQLGFQNANKLQKKSIQYCSARGQAKILDQMMEENFFTEDELEMLARGRNATVHTKAKNADGQTYMKATALEAMLGYLHLYKHSQRLETCLERIIELGDTL